MSAREYWIGIEIVVNSSSGQRIGLFASRLASRSPRFILSNGPVAQLAEHSTLNRQVVGSIPTGSTI